jgi:hypothetical protein
MKRLHNRISFWDVKLDTSGTVDLAIESGDFVLISDLSEIVSQLLLDNLESTFGSMIRLGGDFLWGNEARNEDLAASRYDGARQRTELAVSEALEALGDLVVDVLSTTYVWTRGSNTFDVRIRLILSDAEQTEFDRTIRWDGTTKRAIFL